MTISAIPLYSITTTATTTTTPTAAAMHTTSNTALVLNPHPVHLPSVQERDFTVALIAKQEAALSYLVQQMDMLKSKQLEITSQIANCRSFISPIRRLSFDVLGVIFEHYANSASSAGAPGTGGMADCDVLLGVCRLWRDVALGHPRIWATFVLDDFAPGRGDIYTRRIRRWVKRSGNTGINVDIDARSFPRSQHNLTEDGGSVCSYGRMCSGRDFSCDDLKTVARNLSAWMDELIGVNGSVMKRWKSFSIDLSTITDMCIDSGLDMQSQPTCWIKFMGEFCGRFKWSTPKLQYLEIGGVVSYKPMFPETPCLEAARFSAVKMENFALSGLKTLTVDSGFFARDLWVQMPLAKFKDLETLELRMPTGLPGTAATFLDDSLPSVKTLVLAEGMNAKLSSLDLPNLDHLILQSRASFLPGLSKFKAQEVTVAFAPSSGLYKLKDFMMVIQGLKDSPQIRKLWLTGELCDMVVPELILDSKLLPRLDVLMQIDPKSSKEQEVHFERMTIGSPLPRRRRF